jgi:hypothetical protein
LLSVETTASFFSVSDTRNDCKITSYLLYKTSTEALTSADTELYARLDGSNYADNGAINIQTNIEAALAEQNVVFYIVARTDFGITGASPPISVTLSCVDLTSITAAYAAENGQTFVLPYADDGYLYRIFIDTPSTTETINLSPTTTYTTDRPLDCFATGIDLVSDEAGTSPY